MNNNSLLEIIEQSLVVPHIEKKSWFDIFRNNWVNHIFAIINSIPGIGGALAAEFQTIIESTSEYKTCEFFRKFTCFIYGIGDLTDEQRREFAKDIESSAEDASGNVILGIIDRLDNINKQTILANLVKARGNKYITIEDFFRLSTLLERIPYVDIKLLPNYLDNYYCEDGSTELLYAAGALQQTILDSKEGNKYILSSLGEKLLKFGLNIDTYLERSKGTRVNNASTSTWDTFEE